MAAKHSVVPPQSSFELMGPPLAESPLSFAEKLVTIIWMSEIISRCFGSPSVNVDTEILERCVICIDCASIRPKYTDVLRREVQNLPEIPLSFPDGRFRPLLFTQIENERDALPAAFFEQRAPNKHGHAAAIFPEILLLVWLKRPSSLQFYHGAFVALAPFGRRQIGPTHSTRNEIFTAVLHHAQKRFVGFDDRTFEVPDEDPQNVGVDQTPNLPFAICEIAIKPRVLERDCCLRRKNFQHRYTLRRENARRQIVF